MSETIVGVVLKWAIPAILGALFGAVATQLRQLRKREAAVGVGVQCLLRAELIRCHKEYTAKGYCPVYARESIIKMSDAYHNLGGNDVVTDLKDDVLKLPTEAGKGNAGN